MKAVMRAESMDKLREAFGRLRAGDTGALEDVWRDWARPLHNYAFALSGSQEEADDVVGEVMVALARQGRRLARVREPVAYLFAAVRNRVRTRWRRGWRRAGAPPADGGATDSQQLQDGVAVREAVLALPLEQREVVVLHVWGGLTFDEAGRVVGVSANTAASRYRYALEKLRKVMADEPER